jgi:NAD(P)-dependent dehydrogenase (short-subunit alcohol dehydrogenase family)
MYNNEVLSGRTVAITGIGSGIGKSIALRFLTEGAKLAGVDLYEERLDQFRKDAESLGLDPSRVLTIAGDASDFEFAGTLIDRAVERFGRLDIFINNAGGSMGFGGTAFNDLDRKAWDLTIDTNLYTTLNCTKHALRYMIPQKSGNIVNLSSVQGLGDSNIGGDRFAVYAAAKAGVIAFTRAIAREVAQYRIRVNCISPGLVRTGFLQKTTSEFIEATLKKTPWGRMGEPEDIARTALFLVSDDSDFITGQNICVSGGLVMR